MIAVHYSECPLALTLSLTLLIIDLLTLTLLTINLTLIPLTLTVTLSFGIADVRNSGPVLYTLFFVSVQRS